MIIKYFAYGSNMNPNRVEERGLMVSEVVPATLIGYELAFDKTAAHHQGIGHADIRWKKGGHVEGALYTLVDEYQILKMDPYERAPWNYGRDVVEVCVGQFADRQREWAWTYFANPAFLKAGLQPSPEYLAHLLAGREFLSEGYFEQLENWLDT